MRRTVITCDVCGKEDTVPRARMRLDNPTWFCMDVEPPGGRECFPFEVCSVECLQKCGPALLAACEAAPVYKPRRRRFPDEPEPTP